MKTICAESVLYGEEAMATLGGVEVWPDRAIGPDTVRDADALVVRSKTRVDGRLVAGSRLRFAGTATAGFDHIDDRALAAQGVSWMAAAGCNAVSVAEYVLAALLELSRRHGFRLAGLRLGLVGVGQVGRRLARRAEALGMTVLVNDPPRALAEPDVPFLPLEAMLPQADVVSLHTPLTTDGPFPTAGLAGADFFRLVKPGSIFINAARGEVLCEDALLQAMESGHVRHAVLDVWDHEPYCNPLLLERVDLATPHIAGYSFDGKLRGTEMVYAAACRHFAAAKAWDASALRPASPLPSFEVAGRDADPERVLGAIVPRIYDLTADDRRLREGLRMNREEQGALFDRLRKEYPVRREWAGTTLTLEPSRTADAARYRALGFQV